MNTVIVKVNFTDPNSSPTYPVGTSTNGTLVSLNVPAGGAAIPPQTIAPGATSATFDNVPSGTGYTASAQLLDGNNQPLGAVATSTPFDVEAPTIMIPTPSAITVTVNA